jgi:endonuclease YncB( thermonuclease family)
LSWCSLEHRFLRHHFLQRRFLQKLCQWALPLLLLALLALLPGCTTESSGIPAGPYTVAEVFDGDSFNLKAANAQTVRIRIAGIDAPEKSQPYSLKSKAALEAILTAGPITLKVIKQDRFDRWVAHVIVNDKDVGLRQIETGWAWYFKRYKSDLTDDIQSRYERAERQARADQHGLWAWSTAPEPPWKFRERTRAEKK